MSLESWERTEEDDGYVDHAHGYLISDHALTELDVGHPQLALKLARVPDLAEGWYRRRFPRGSGSPVDPALDSGIAANSL